MVKKKLPEIRWAQSAETSLRKAYQHIKETSVVNAENVKKTII